MLPLPLTSTRRGGTAPHPPGRRATTTLRIVLLAIGGFLAFWLLEAGSAHALGFEALPVSPITVGVPIAKAIASAPLKAAVAALLSVLEAIFGGIEAKLITGVIKGLLTVPTFNTGHIVSLEHTTDSIALGMLGAVLTLAILRYYLAGLTDSGSGGFEAIQGLIRTVGAVGFIVAWPGIYTELLQIPAMFNTALLGSGTVQHSVAELFNAALVVGGGVFTVSSGLGLIFVVLMGSFSALVFIGLLWMKVLLSVMMMFLYVAMPLCVVMWPVPELAWLASAAMRSLFVGMLVPCVWAILFALSAAVNTDVLTWAPSHSIIDTVIIRPLAGITLMLLCITLPRFLIRTAMIGPHGQAGGGWRVWRTLTFGVFAARGAAGMARTVATAASEGHPGAQRMIDALPAQAKPPSGPGEGTLAGRVVFARSGFAAAGEQTPPVRGRSPQPQPGPASAAPTSQQASAAAAAGGAEEAIRRQEAGFSVPGIERPAYDRASVDRAYQSMSALSRLSPPDTAAVTQAMGEFSPATQQGLARFSEANPGRMRQWAAQHLAASDLTDGQRSALLTLGGARQGALEHGIKNAIRGLDQPVAGHAPAPAQRQAPSAPAARQLPTAHDSDAPGGTPEPPPAIDQPASHAEPGSTGAPGPSGGPDLTDSEPFLD